MACDQRCDLNSDGAVDDKDEAIFKAANGSKIGDSNWNPACDFNGDGKVDFDDFVHFSDSIGCTFGNGSISFSSIPTEANITITKV